MLLEALAAAVDVRVRVPGRHVGHDVVVPPERAAPGDRGRSRPRSRAGPRRGRLAAHGQYAAAYGVRRARSRPHPSRPRPRRCALLHGAGTRPRDAARPVPPLRSEGRWITDATGRVVQLRGVNEVAKSAPYYPAAFGFGADDADFLARARVQLGAPRGRLPRPDAHPRPGRVRLHRAARAHRAGARPARDLRADRLPPGRLRAEVQRQRPARLDGDRRRAARTRDDAVFPLYYIQNPAMQRAFESLWANRPGPGGIGLQDYFVQGVTAVARRFARLAARARLRRAERAVPGRELDAVRARHRLPGARAAAVRAVQRQGHRGDPPPVAPPARVRRAVRALQLRRGPHLAARGGHRQRAVVPLLRRRRRPPSRRWWTSR